MTDLAAICILLVIEIGGGLSIIALAVIATLAWCLWANRPSERK